MAVIQVSIVLVLCSVDYYKMCLLNPRQTFSGERETTWLCLQCDASLQSSNFIVASNVLLLSAEDSCSYHPTKDHHCWAFYSVLFADRLLAQIFIKGIKSLSGTFTRLTRSSTIFEAYQLLHI